ncbi:hypothetical protein DPMN_182128 [Dreissena polymorpha]|uniref:Uncharacterized protein n=2 Tax=Dreissena polymorpha TaxID=45954 RepID=A0A9D4I4D6_DREPO|nr:hypothetical protein DPMN_182128 [Dreissena polymorpha]
MKTIEQTNVTKSRRLKKILKNKRILENEETTEDINQKTIPLSEWAQKIDWLDHLDYLCIGLICGMITVFFMTLFAIRCAAKKCRKCNQCLHKLIFNVPPAEQCRRYVIEDWGCCVANGRDTTSPRRRTSHQETTEPLDRLDTSEVNGHRQEDQNS